MTIPPTWLQSLDFFHVPLVIEPSRGPLPNDAGLLPIRQFDPCIGLARPSSTLLMPVPARGRLDGYAPRLGQKGGPDPRDRCRYSERRRGLTGFGPAGPDAGQPRQTMGQSLEVGSGG
jgi:hypothetical protein